VSGIGCVDLDDVESAHVGPDDEEGDAEDNDDRILPDPPFPPTHAVVPEGDQFDYARQNQAEDREAQSADQVDERSNGWYRNRE